MSSDYSSDGDVAPPPPPPSLPPLDQSLSISAGSSLLASLVKAKPPASEASESSDDDDDDEEENVSQPPPSDDDMDEDELEQLLVKQEAHVHKTGDQAQASKSATSTPSNLCEVCGEDTSNAKRALVCAQCGVRFHPTCFRQKYAKLIQTNHLKKWFCPDCEPIKKIAVTPKGKGKRRGGGDSKAAAGTTPDKKAKTSAGAAPSQASLAGTSSSAKSDDQYARLVDIALKAGKKFNGMVVEKGEEMLSLAQSLKQDVENHLGIKKQEPKDDSDDENATGAGDDDNDDQPLASAASSSSGLASTVLLRKLVAGLSQLESLIYTLQFHAVQTEVDLIKEVKFPTNLEQKSLEREAKELQKAKLKVKTGGGASRLYSSAQIAKLEEWYGKSSRPESSEIQAMYRIINAPAYADSELQPEGIAVKQIRIWFDNRRAKERLDYMRMKMKDLDTSSMDAEAIKKMKAAYIDEAKEVLEARVAKMRETSTGAMDIIEEAEQLVVDPTSVTASAGAHSGGEESVQHSPPDVKKPAKAKHRLRMDHVASVRKAVKVSREMGLSEEEIKEERSRAIQAARDRLYWNGKPLGAHPLTKDEVTHLKFQLINIVEQDEPAENCMDILELLLSVELPAQVLLDTRLDRQLRLLAKAMQDNKEVVRLANKLSDHIQAVVNQTSLGDGAPASGLASTDAEENGSAKDEKTKQSRVKFTVEQLLLLEKAFQQNESPDKETLVKLGATLNKTSGGSGTHDYKQLRCWFYKRKAAGHPPSAIADVIATKGENLSDIGTASDREHDDDDHGKSRHRVWNDQQVALLNAAYAASIRPSSAVVQELVEQLNRDNDGAAVAKTQLEAWFAAKRVHDRRAFIDQRVKAAQEAGDDNLEAVKAAAELEFRQVHELSDHDSDDDDKGSHNKADGATKRKPDAASLDGTTAAKKLKMEY
ncbi:unnamed protein product [Aphanomyces euteiches]